MNCETTRQILGAYFDGETSAEERHEVESHLATCPACANELASIRNLASRLAPAGPAVLPAGLWSAIERQLPGAETARWRLGYELANLRRFAIAASFLLLVGLGAVTIIWSGGRASEARAATIDFGALLDGLPDGAENAFQKFLARYGGRSVSLGEARRVGCQCNLSFDVPETLPGGFQRREVFALQFGDHPGVAACYTRGTEFLAAIFHTPVKVEDFGTHKDYPCVVGRHHGHRVDVGDWKLVHLTDATTCHCVLSRLDEKTELPAILTAVAPGFSGNAAAHEAQP